MRCESIYVSIDYTSSLKDLNILLRLLVDNEIFRLTVWTNPTNDAKRGVDHFGTVEKTMTEASVSQPVQCILDSRVMYQAAWSKAVRKAWQVDPAIAVYLTERFSDPSIHHEVGRLVRSRTRDVLDIAEGLRFLVGDRTGSDVRRDLKV